MVVSEAARASAPFRDEQWEMFYHFGVGFFTLVRVKGPLSVRAWILSFLVLYFELQAFQCNLKFTEVFLKRLKNEQSV